MKPSTLLLASLVLAALPWSEAAAGGPHLQVQHRSRVGRVFPVGKLVRHPRHSRSSTGNVLVLLADDLGVDQLASYGVGSDLPFTPNIDALAASGVQFENAWSNPVCSPTRALIQTGRYGFRTGVGFVTTFAGTALPLSELTIPEMLDQGTGQGYAQAAFGKWHLGTSATGGASNPNLAGYSHFSGTLDSIVAPDTYFDWPHVVDGVQTRETRYEPEVLTDEALAWITAQTKPWFAYVAFNLPHDPFHRPPDNLHSVNFTGVDPDPRNEPRPYYKAMVEAMDTEIGRLLAGIDPTELAQTTVIFLGDNGTPKDVTVAPFLPSHAKSTVYEGGVHVPLIVSGPLVQSQGTSCTSLVDAVDLYATVADIAGVNLAALAPNTTFDSVSLLPYLANPGRGPLRSALYAEIFYPNGQPPAGGLPYLCERPTGPSVPPVYGNLPAQRWTCQEDVGFGGPGNAMLSICGQALFNGGSSNLTIAGGPPSTTGFLVVSPGFAPMPYHGGTIVPEFLPQPLLQIQPIVTGPRGSYHQTVQFQVGTDFLFYQAVLDDPSQPANESISNAVRARMFDQEGAIRNDRYKLIFDAYTCAESFFDLQVDPFELNDLLVGPLTTLQQQNYDQLKAQLALLH